MKQLIFLIFLSFFIIPGCTFLRGKSDVSQDEFSEDEEFFEGGELVEGDEEFSEDDEEFAEEDEVEDEEFSEDDEEFSEEDEKPTGLKGFFSRIFGSSDEEEDFLEDEEDGEAETMAEADAFSEEDMGYEEYKEEYKEDSPEEVTNVAESDQTPSQEETTTQTQTAALPKQEKTAEVPTTKPAQAKNVSLKKIKSIPYQKAGYLVNAVYVARPDETLKRISQKIYGIDQLDMLHAINPHLKSRSVKVGDKIYYNSPFRKEDSSRLLFYYQDVNAPSSIHILSPGDNIRQVASQLLGHPNSWKEIWATNPELESKGEITKNINIVYWSSDVAAEQKVASVDKPLVTEQEEEPMNLEDKAPFPEEGFVPPDLEDKESKKVEASKKDKMNVLGINLRQKEILFVLLVIIILLMLMIRLILKKRKQRDFDYTANIEV